MINDTKNHATLGDRLEQHLRDHKGKYILQGVTFIVSGCLAATLSSTTALHTEMIIALALLVTGIFQLVLTAKSKMHWWSLLSGLLSIIVGAIIVWQPFPVLLAVVTLMALFMTLEGVLEILLAFWFRPVRHWGWMFFSGAIALAMAAILWLGYPTFDVLYLGWLVAINMILYGISLLMLLWRTVS